MAEPTIHFNPSTGSDTAASGAGPGDGVTGGTAISGTGAAHTGGVASTTITLTNTPDLSGVAVDGSHALWLNTASGRQWSKITAVDNGADTVTVADSFNIGSGAAVDYAIGGKRNTINDTDSRQLFTDVKPNWVIDLEDGTYTLTSVISFGTSGDATGPITVTSSTSARAVVTTSTSGISLFQNNSNYVWRLQHIEFTHTGATRGQAVAPNNVQTTVDVIDCVVDGCSTLTEGNFTSMYSWLMLNVIDTEIHNCTGAGITNASGGMSMFVSGCYIHDNASHGIECPNTTTGQSSLSVVNSVITDNGGRGVYYVSAASGTKSVQIVNCTIANNVASGVECTFVSSAAGWLYLLNSIIYGNGDYGAEVTLGAPIEINCAYGANTTGARSGVTAGLGAVALSADPFTNAAAGDYSLNTTSGGGAACRAVGFPGAWDSATMTGYNSIGALQIEDGGGGGGGAFAFAVAG